MATRWRVYGSLACVLVWGSLFSPAVGPLPTSSALAAQEVEDGARAPRGAQFLLPFGSLLVPGLGQYVQGAPGPGLAYTGTAILGLVVAERGDPDFTSGDDLPRSGRDQLAFEGAQLAFTASALSAWDSFHRAVPAMQREGKYAFLPPRESLGQVLAAPFDVTFLERWTTWVGMAYALGVAGAVLSQRDDGVEYEPFTGGDAAFVGGLSFNAAVAEEAMFRGWLLPMLHQTTGRRFWTANAVQAALFGAGHVDGAGGFTIAIVAWATYEGWLTRRNGWSIRESIFHHFWYDVLVASATLLADERLVLRMRIAH